MCVKCNDSDTMPEMVDQPNDDNSDREDDPFFSGACPELENSENSESESELPTIRDRSDLSESDLSESSVDSVIPTMLEDYSDSSEYESSGHRSDLSESESSFYDYSDIPDLGHSAALQRPARRRPLLF